MKYPYVVERILDHYPDLNHKSVAARVRQGSFVSLNKRYMYFEVSKAACTQMKELLRTVEDAPPVKLLANCTWQSRRDMYIHARPNVPLPSLVDLDNKTQREVLESPDFLRMTVVRNPYTRLVSAWRNRVLMCEPGETEVYLHVKGRLPGIRNKSLVSFEEFIEYLETACDLRTCNCHWRRQVDHLFFPALNFSHVGKVKELGNTLRRFEQHIGLQEPLTAEGRNASLSVGSAAYTQELADRVYRLYRADFEAFGYDRSSWPAGRNVGNERNASVPVEKFCDEVIERNLVIRRLCQERKSLQIQLDRVSRLRLLPVVNGIVACRSASRKVARGVREWMRGARQSAGSGQGGSATLARRVR